MRLRFPLILLLLALLAAVFAAAESAGSGLAIPA